MANDPVPELARIIAKGQAEHQTQMGSLSGRIRDHVHRTLYDQEVWEYEDLKMAISSHMIDYKKLDFYAASEEILLSALTSVLGCVKDLGGRAVAWRTTPDVQEAPAGLKFYARFHIVPLEADIRFWRVVSTAFERLALEETNV